MLVLWNRHGSLMLNFRPQDATINADSYCSTLSRLWAAIWRVLRDSRFVDKVIIIHDIMAIRARDKLWSSHLEIFNQPLKGLDLSPGGDFYIFYLLNDSDSRPTMKTAGKPRVVTQLSGINSTNRAPQI
ncbi:hypothetical protein TNIN_200801 [Trichonephila inaurata madagascariensis]|uniref:Uncharacterized protein n=1 Tax=Trichonephila inaurata madagascariensis TaxID=2747483 RepID=A0A8X6JND6_9ARAC|nr:hypothetical protein TNIN_200801 [Trichonephila inaurata madagascariensis]